jgi:hypothetical protein
MFQTKVGEKIETHILCPIFFFRKSCRLCYVEKYCVQREQSRAIRTETGMTKLMVALSNFANAPRNEISTSTESP